jgi:hypothetical protein
MGLLGPGWSDVVALAEAWAWTAWPSWRNRRIGPKRSGDGRPERRKSRTHSRIGRAGGRGRAPEPPG